LLGLLTAAAAATTAGWRVGDEPHFDLGFGFKVGALGNLFGVRRLDL
jgi:hypothetical protein